MPPTWRWPFSSTDAERGRRCRSSGAVATSWSVDMEMQDTAAFGGPVRAEIAIAPCRVPSSSALACPAPVAQRIEHRPPEPVAQVRVLPGALTFSQIRRHFWKLCRLSLLKSQPSTWCLNAFAGRDSNGRKRYTSKTLHGTKKDGHRSGGVRHRGRQRENHIIASGSDHGFADARQMAGLEEGSALPRYNRPISSCDQARRTGDWVDACLSTATAPHRRPLQRAGDRRTVGVVNPEDPLGTSPIAGLGPRRGYVSIIATDGVELPHSGPEKWSRHPPTMYARLSNTCSRPILIGALLLRSSPGPVVAGGKLPGFVGKMSTSSRATC